MSHIEDFTLEIDYLRGDLAKRDAEIERLHEQVQDMIDISGQECGCGYDKPDDVCLGHWPAYKKQQDEIERLREALIPVTEALDLAQSLLEKSRHHAHILSAYKLARAALAPENKDA